MKHYLPRLTIFTGAFLLFGVQPMVGSTLLPVFGGTAAVWTVCLAAFQTLLLAGYFYAHLMAGGEGQAFKKKQLHIALLFVAVAVTFGAVWARPHLGAWVGTQGAPILSVFGCVLLLAGVPYTLLAANSSLVQAWLAKSGGRDVYHLYAVSNAGSFCGLLAYPLLVEPYVTLTAQWCGFAAGVGGYAVLLALLARSRLSSPDCRRPADSGERAPEQQTPAAGCRLPADPCPPSSDPRLWLVLPAVSTFTLNAVTAHLGNDVAPLPLLWAVLLALFLLSYIIGFTALGLKLLPRLPVVLFALLAVSAWQWGMPTSRGFAVEVSLGMLSILLGCTMLHAWLYRIRPAEAKLTRYYLDIALGGALGGTAASIAAPLLFNSIIEYPLSLLMLSVAAGWLATGRGGCGSGLRLPVPLVAGAAAVIAGFLIFQSFNVDGKVILRMRNFYGCGRVRQEKMAVKGGEPYMANLFDHSGTLHGFQAQGFERQIPTLCFTRHAGGLSIVRHPLYTSKKAMRVAVAGMGIGTLAAYGRPGDSYRFYEINPQVVALATNTALFTFIQDSAANVDIVVDDARRALEGERQRGEEKWDVLIIDVYSGDAIPPHMSTKEAFQLYLDRLAPDGILSLHLTNWHLNLSPMVKMAAKEFGLHLQGFGCWADKYSHGSYWTFLTRQPVDLYIEGKHGRVDYTQVKDIPIMTDQRHSLLPYLSLEPMPSFGDDKDQRITRPAK
jgi:hypothetical protein